jgi:hypothetical protein
MVAVIVMSSIAALIAVFAVAMWLDARPTSRDR